MSSPEQPDATLPDDVLHSGAAGGKVVRGGVIRTAGFGVGVLFGLGTSALLLRHLGVVDYGKYGTIAALLGLVLALSDGGLTSIGARELSTTAAGPERKRVASTLMLVRLVTTTIGVLIAVVFAALAYSSGELTLGAALVGASVVLISMQAMATMHDMAAQLLILHVEGAATYLGPDWCAHCRHIEDIAAAHGVGRARVALQSCKTGGGALASCSRAAQKQRPHCCISIPTSVPLSRQPRTREARVRRRREHDIQRGTLQARGIDGGRVGRNLWVGWMDEGMGRVW